VLAQTLSMASGRTASEEGAGAPAGGPAGIKPVWHEDTSAQLSKIQWRTASTPQVQQKDRATAALAAVKWRPRPDVQKKHMGRGKDAFATGAKATKRPLAGDGDRDSDSGGGGKEEEDCDRDSSSLPPVDAFKLLGARYKQVWAAKRPRAAVGNRGGCSGGKFDEDRDGDDRIVGQGSFSTVPSRGVKPNAAQAASPRSTHGYFTRSASAEIVAGAGAPAGGPAGGKADWHEDTSAQLGQSQWRPASTKRPRAAVGNRGGCAGGKFNTDGDGDDRIVGQGSFSTVPSRGVKPNAAQAASPRSTHGYFTRSASAEIVASLDEFLRIL